MKNYGIRKYKRVGKKHKEHKGNRGFVGCTICHPWYSKECAGTFITLPHRDKKNIDNFKDQMKDLPF